MLIDFHVNPELESLHQTGVGLANRGSFDEAVANYNEAFCQLGEAYPGSTFEQRTANMPSLALHKARIQRDFGWVPVLRASAGEHTHIDAAEHYLGVSFAHTENLLEAGEKEYAPTSWTTLLAEHGATISLLARHSIFRGVLLDDDITIQPDIDEGIELFHQASDFLRRGGNRYYETSNAIHAARAEKINGHPAQVSRWMRGASWSLARGIGSLPVATAADRKNVIGSALTLANHGRTLLSTKSAAREAIRKHP